MAGGEDSIASLAFAARDLHDHLQRVSALAHQFAPSVECWDAATAEFIEICRTEAARQLAAESAATPSEEVPF
jgi:predicted ATPase